MERISTFGERYGVRSYIVLKFIGDLLLWTLAAPLAFALRLEAGITGYLQSMVAYTLVGIPLKALAISLSALHRQSWHKVGTRDLYKLLRTLASAMMALFAIAFLASPTLRVPRSIPLLEAGLALVMLGGIRLGLRLFNEKLSGRSLVGGEKRVVVVGAGEAGTMLVREMLRHPGAGLNPVGYLDDESSKQRQFFFGVPVLGVIDDLPAVVRRTDADEILIAMPSAPGDIIRRVVTLARKAEVHHRIIPGVYDILAGRVSITSIRDVDVEDLLRRAPVELNLEQIAAYLEDRVVLVTGAGGSIGSELVRQIVAFNPARVILLDRDENNLYLFKRELDRDYAFAQVEMAVMDIQRRDKLLRLFEQERPEVVFHAAAYKHVPMMELHPDEAILNNVCGTRYLLEAAQTCGVKRFVNISTDKAVRPTSMMGASKRVSEYLVEKAAEDSSNGHCYVSVRFGNVLGSRGSVVPIFKRQIRAGGPLTITHPEMTRYFMSITEASQLVLQAAGLGENGAVYILDMGDPVRIMDLARDLIELSGFDPDHDIEIEIIGPRPGEKLYEELLTAEEGITATRHEQIYHVKKNGITGAQYTLIDDLLDAARDGNLAALSGLLRELIPTYHSDEQQADPKGAAGIHPIQVQTEKQS